MIDWQAYNARWQDIWQGGLQKGQVGAAVKQLLLKAHTVSHRFYLWLKPCTMVCHVLPTWSRLDVDFTFDKNASSHQTHFTQKFTVHASKHWPTGWQASFQQA